MTRYVTFICAFVACMHVNSARSQDEGSDQEQEYLEVCYNFTGLLGYTLEPVQPLTLYKLIWEWLGTPYKYSGDEKSGIDCSGFACMIYKNTFGIELAGSAEDIFHKDVKPLKKNSLEAGDLVFFKIKKHRISHVGVCIGENKFAHASTQNGVIVSDLNDPYYKKYFFKGGRVQKK